MRGRYDALALTMPAHAANFFRMKSNFRGSHWVEKKVIESACETACTGATLYCAVVGRRSEFMVETRLKPGVGRRKELL